MKKEYGWLYNFVRIVLSPFNRKYTLDKDTLPSLKEPTVFIGHHENLKGPFRILMWIPFFVRTWIMSDFYDQEECFNQYVNFTFTKRFGLPKTLAKALALPASHFVSNLMHSGGGLPVYRKSRKIMRTLKESIQVMEERIPVLIFPDIEYSNEDEGMGDIYEGFLNLERLYYKKHNEHINFVPFYANKSNRSIICGSVINFKDDSSFKEQQSNIATQINTELNELILADKAK